MVLINSGKTNSSSGNWYVHYSITRTDYKGRPYQSEQDEYFWSKAQMQRFIDIVFN